MPTITMQTQFEVGQRVRHEGKRINGTITSIRFLYEAWTGNTQSSLAYNVTPDAKHHHVFFWSQEDELELIEGGSNDR